MKKILMNGTPMSIKGTELKIGDKAPDFTLTKVDLSPAKLQDYKGKVVILSVVPSIDTPVCTIETRRFNKEASELGGNIVFLTASKDLPFAQKRWTDSFNTDKIIMLSDYRNPEFGTDYGVLIEEIYILSRAVFVIDKEGVIRHIDFLEDVGKEPDYKVIIEKAKELDK